MQWFGKNWGGGICQQENHIPTPENTNCLSCQEPILPNDKGIRLASDYIHLECHIRAITGGANHLRKLCSCYGGKLAPDPPELTRRQTARLAYKIYLQQQNPGAWQGSGLIKFPVRLLALIGDTFDISSQEAFNLIERLRNPSTDNHRRVIDRRLIKGAIYRYRHNKKYLSEKNHE